MSIPDPNNPDFRFEELFSELVNLLQFLVDNAQKPLKGEIPPDIESKLTQLENKVEAFKSISELVMAQMGLTPKELQELLIKSASSRTIHEKKLMEKAEQLKVEVEKRREFLSKVDRPKLSKSHDQTAIASIPQKSLSEKKDLAKNPNARKSLFKRMGGDKNWRPL